ncbi:non-ribosomal peptide synthetase, partial [Xenorhabdus bovienii]|uniref:phosphopantetheine-binding protein n=1 Tax=Xenorhabdus bovienii TaxID=40576 RepID=UPI0023B31F32
TPKAETEPHQNDMFLLNAQEQTVAAIWQSLLNTEQLSPDSDFFQLGGDSLLATRLIGELAQQGLKAELSHLFRHPQLAAFTATLTPLAAPLPDISSDSYSISKGQDEDSYQPFP